MKFLIYFFGFAFITTLIHPQEVTYVRGKVVYISENNVEELQAGITVLIEETGDRDKTDNNGIFRIFLNDKFTAGDRITLKIENEDWAIRDPLFGKTYVSSDPQKEIIKLNILPKGSPLFFTEQQIMRYIEHLVLKRTGETETSIINYKKLSIENLLDSMAVNWGFSVSEIKLSVQSWVEKTLKDTNNLYERGLAEYTRKNFDIAGELFNQSANLRTNLFRIIDEEFKKTSEERRSLINETIRDLHLAGESYFDAKNYDSSLVAYKASIEFLNYAEDWETLASTLNKIAIGFYYLSLKSIDESKFQHLDSSNAYLSTGLELSQNKSLEEWKWKFKGNLATLVAEREMYSDQPNKPQRLLNAIKGLVLVYEKKGEDSDSKDIYLSKNNIGICYYLLYEFIDSLVLAERYMDSSLISYSTILNDSSFKINYPLEWAIVNNNFALSILKRSQQIYDIPSLYEYLTYKILVKSNLTVSNPSFESPSRNRDLFIEELENTYKKFLDAEKIFRDDEGTFELASVLNSIALLRVRLIIYSQKPTNDKFISRTDSIINVANKLASEDRFAREEMNSLVNRSLLEISKYLHGKLSPQDEIVQSINNLENRLHKKPILDVYSVYLKRLLLINYLIRYSSSMSNDQKGLYYTKALSLIYDIQNSYKKLSYFRELEEARNIGKLIEYIEPPHR